MSTTDDISNIDFDLPKHKSNVIKVIGVGGGGGNAINHMFEAGINGVDFVICNTDSQALQNSPVPNKIQLGVSLTEGLGAGANPEIGEQAAMESMEDIKNMLGPTTKMVFITAGMGGGTGTGAAPIIAKFSKEMDILTVGIVTIPFQFEGSMRTKQAQAGIERLRENVDSLIVINNNKLREIYGNLGFKAGFSKADEVLATAARGIAEVITHHYMQNIDLRDAKTVLSDSGTAIMGSSQASGSTRANEAITEALDSPLLNDNKIKGAKNVLLLIVSGTQEITIDEIGEINDYIQVEAGYSANIIMGVGEDETLGEAISVTVIATGFDVDQQDDIVNTETKKIVHQLDGAQKAALAKPESVPVEPEAAVEQAPAAAEEEVIIKHQLDDTETEKEDLGGLGLVPTTDELRNLDVVYEEVKPEVIAAEVPTETLETELDQAVSEEEFVIIETSEQLRDIDVVEPEEVSSREQLEQTALAFELPLVVDNPVEEEEEEIVAEDEAPTITFDLSDESMSMEEEAYIEVDEIVETPPLESSETRFDLQDYMELEKQLAGAQPAEEKETAVADEPVLKRIDQETEASTGDPQGEVAAEENPFDNSIDEILKDRVDDRRKKMKDFNHKFSFRRNSIEDIEKEPAYKRQGVDLGDVPKEQKVSRTSLSEDSNEDMQLRSNNSFLHDNVD